MNLRRANPAGVLRGLVIVGGTMAHVESRDTRHLVSGQSEVEHLVTYSNSYSRLDFLLDVGGVRRAGDDRKALQNVPADDDLCCRLAVSTGNLANGLVAQDFALRVAASEGERLRVGELAREYQHSILMSCLAAISFHCLRWA